MGKVQAIVEESDVDAKDLVNGQANLDDDEFKNGDEDLPPLEDVYETKDQPTTSEKTPSQEDDMDPDGWLDVLDNKELRKRTIHPGDVSRSRPERGNLVLINLTVRLQETQQIVESQSAKNLKVFVGDYDLIHGLDLALPLMHVGETCQIVISSRFGFGKFGNADDIPPDATLDCEMELLACRYSDDECELSLDERIKIGSQKKEKGNWWFARGDYSTCTHCYRRAVEFLDAKDEEMDTLCSEEGKDDLNKLANSEIEKVKKLIELRTASFNNLAAAQMKLETYDAALKSVESALQTDPNNVKALFRKGKILAVKGDLQPASEALKKAMELEPETKAIQMELTKVLHKMKKELMVEKDLYKRMLKLDKSSSPSKSNSRRRLLKWSLIGGVVVSITSAIAIKLLYSNDE